MRARFSPKNPLRKLTHALWYLLLVVNADLEHILKLRYRDKELVAKSRIIWIAQDRIEIDHGIKRAAGPDPFIELLPICFLGEVMAGLDLD